VHRRLPERGQDPRRPITAAWAARRNCAGGDTPCVAFGDDKEWNSAHTPGRNVDYESREETTMSNEQNVEVEGQTARGHFEPTEEVEGQAGKVHFEPAEEVEGQTGKVHFEPAEEVEGQSAKAHIEPAAQVEGQSARSGH
jgi:hypothetical protein